MSDIIQFSNILLKSTPFQCILIIFMAMLIGIILAIRYHLRITAYLYGKQIDTIQEYVHNLKEEINHRNKELEKRDGIIFTKNGQIEKLLDSYKNIVSAASEGFKHLEILMAELKGKIS